MSSETLKINADPLKEGSDKIEFTVDKLGLTNPARTIPTDVDYFIRKQQGDLESKYTFPQAVKKAFEIDNLFVSGITKLNQHGKHSYLARFIFICINTKSNTFWFL